MVVASTPGMTRTRRATHRSRRLFRGSGVTTVSPPSPEGQSGALAFEEVALRRVRAEVDGTLVGGAGVVVPAGAGEEVGAGGVVGLVVVERGGVERLDRGQAVHRALELGDGDCAVEGDHRVGTERVELVVE